MPIWIENQQPRFRIDVGALKKILACCLKKVQLSRAELSVLLTNDRTLLQLNRKYCKKNKPTDILSFGMRELREASDPWPPHPEVLGDLVVSLETVDQGARARKLTLQEELEYICVHGLLHLIGYDHVTRTQELRMKALQAALIAACRKK